MHREQLADIDVADARARDRKLFFIPNLSLLQARPPHPRCPLLFPPLRSVDSNATRERKHCRPEPDIVGTRFVLPDERRDHAARRDNVGVRIGENDLACTRAAGRDVEDADLRVAMR